MLLNDQPLYMPPGSIRGLLALSLVGGFMADLVPIEVVTLVLGFYFGVRQTGE